MAVSRGDAIAFRLHAQHLTERSDEVGLLAATGACGVQNSPPGSALLALHARVRDLTPERLDRAVAEDKSLLQSWCMRGAPFYFPTADARVFTAGALPPTEEARQQLIIGVRPAVDELGLSLTQAVDLTGAEIPDVLYLLLARLLYADALAAIFIFGGIYGTQVFHWGTFDRGVFGIILTLAGAIGAILGGFLDDRIGAKTVIVGALFALLAGIVGILSVDPTHVLFKLEVPEKVAGSRPFSSTGELFYLAFALVIGIVAAPVQAATRSLLARLAPPDRITQYFGLFAFSGKATAFLAPLLIAAITQATGSQRWGVAVTALFLVAGILLMLPVRARRGADASR